MHLIQFEATNFRNLKNVRFKPAPKVNLLFGPNGSGKTNILEGIFLLFLGRSQRGYKDPVLIRDGQEAYRLEGTMIDQEAKHEVAIACSNRGRKQITIDGVKSRLPELYEKFSAVSIGPEDSELLAGPPAARRLFMDIYISQYSRKYLDSLTRYNRIVAQKNAALKDGLDFDTFNELMVSSGAEIMRTRGEYLQMLLNNSSKLYSNFSNGSEFQLKYMPSVYDKTEWNEKNVESVFERRLIESKEKEKILKTAIIGPHRDEIEFSINNLPARTHASQGEWRSSAIALKLAVYHLLKTKRRLSPILLLDEVFAELDDNRSSALINSFGEFEQIFLTSAEIPSSKLSGSFQKFRVSEGTVEEVN